MPPLKAAIIPVTPLQQNCSLRWCTATSAGAFVDPGGDLDRLKAAAADQKVRIEKILLTHGHIDHCGSAGILAMPHAGGGCWRGGGVGLLLGFVGHQSWLITLARANVR